jgi:hypothetical protein
MLAAGLFAGAVAAAPISNTPSPSTANPLGVASAAAKPVETYTYTIRHETLGVIGTHVAQFRRNGEETLVHVRIDLDVRLAFVRLYRFESHGREVWRDGRLIDLETVTNDDGRMIKVSARAAGDVLVIDGPAGRMVSDGGVNTTNLWNASQLMVSHLVEPTSRNLYRVDITDRGEDHIRWLDRLVPTHRYSISGEIEGELWYANDGTWLQFDFRKNGSTLRLALDSVAR